MGVFADRPAREVAAVAARLGLDAVQLHGHERPGDLDRIPLPVLKVLHIPVAAAPDDAPRPMCGGPPSTPPTWPSSTPSWPRRSATSPRTTCRPSCSMLRHLAPSVAPAVGRPDRLARAIACRIPVILAGGLDAANVAEALVDIPAIGVDVSSGVEPRPRVGPSHGGHPPQHPPGRPVKDPLAVALFIKRASSARLDRPTVPFGPQPVDPGLLEADAQGRWGVDRAFGGRFVPETLMAALLDLEAAYARIRSEPSFWAEFRELLAHYVGRPTPVYRADRLAAEVERRAGREPGRLRLYLKREDLDHTGAHKINNALGQALLTKRLGKPRVIAETGAGQHGVATATACALLGLECVVYMGAEDIRRQAPNVLRMRALGAEVARGHLRHGARSRTPSTRRCATGSPTWRPRHYVPRLGRRPAPLPDHRPRPAAGHRRRGRRAGPRRSKAACRTSPWPASAAARTPSACWPASSARRTRASSASRPRGRG